MYLIKKVRSRLNACGPLDVGFKEGVATLRFHQIRSIGAAVVNLRLSAA